MLFKGCPPSGVKSTYLDASSVRCCRSVDGNQIEKSRKLGVDEAPLMSFLPGVLTLSERSPWTRKLN